MEIRNLPIPLHQYPASSPERDAKTTSRQKNPGEAYARSVKGAEQSQSANTAIQQQASVTLQSLSQQRPPPQNHSGNLHNPELRHSAQRAINIYEDIDSQDEQNRSAEILSRIDTLV